MTDHRFYVYTLENSVTRQVFYVGKGRYGRINHHEQRARQGRQGAVADYIRLLWAEGTQVIKTKIYFTEDEAESLQYESDLIRSTPGLINNRRFLPGRVVNKKAPAAPIPSGYVPPKDIAIVHSVGVPSVIRWCKTGRIQGAIIIRRKWFIPQNYAQTPSSLVSHTEEYMTAQEATNYLGVCRSTLDSYARQGELVRYKTSFARVVFSRKEIEALKEPKPKE